MKVNRKRKAVHVRRVIRSRHKRRAHKPKQVALPLAQIFVHGDLQELTTEQKLAYYIALCKSLKLNPLSRPFEYIYFYENMEREGKPKLILYATKNCTDQLRKLHKISVVKIVTQKDGDFFIATVEVKDKTGRTDVDTGVVNAREMTGQKLGDAMMWASTKAKRRATLSICGLGILDESELHSLGEYNHVTPGGRVIKELHPDAPGHKVTKTEVAANVLAAAGQTSSIYYRWYENEQRARISGSVRLRDANADLLEKYWDTRAGGVVVNVEQLEHLKVAFELRGVPFEELVGHSK